MPYFASVCGTRSPNVNLPDTYVVGGTHAAAGAWPWMTSFRFDVRHGCGASLIDHNWLLTAAHCVVK